MRKYENLTNEEILKRIEKEKEEADLYRDCDDGSFEMHCCFIYDLNKELEYRKQ